MGDYRVTVSMPTAAYMDYPVIIGLLSVEGLPEPPTLLELDGFGGFKQLHREQGESRPDSSEVMIGVRVHAASPLAAVTKVIALVAQKMHAAELDAHYPTVYHVLPVTE
jgi:hypothetical protein